MKPCYALLSNGQYLNLRHATSLLVSERTDQPAGVWHVVMCCGSDAFALYTWSAYPDPYTGGGTSGETGNEVAAREMLSRLMLALASDHPDAGGIIDMDDLAADVVSDLGLDSTVPKLTELPPYEDELSQATIDPRVEATI